MEHGDEEEHECLSENGDCGQRDTYFTLSSPKPKSSRSSRYRNWFLPSLKCPLRMSECRISFDFRHKDDRMSLSWLCPFVEDKKIKHRLTNISVIELALVGMVFWMCLYTACLVLILLQTHLFIKLAILAFTFPHYYCLVMATRGIWRSEPNDLKPLLAFNVTVIVIGIAFSIVFSLLLLVHSPRLQYAIVLDLWMPLFVVFVISVQKFLWDANYEA
ncbi:hypothetical protein DdX_07356 [Ditylenchus destructor]|uniref:Uncharacterized protein n=1 Tax=Ditylenchus destructor TaxID=166010 RepID=A0AAD4R8A3_9BILA|nr:hypothetical protein DdX_07356 [Ditylenchus destructor]